MTKEEKTDINLDITNLIKKLVDAETKTDAIMYMWGDNEYQSASLCTKGDMMLLANTIQHYLKNNEEFRKFIYATIGSYISLNQQDEFEFLEGIKLMKQSSGMN